VQRLLRVHADLLPADGGGAGAAARAQGRPGGHHRWCSNLFVDIFIQTISMQLTSVFRGISAPIRVKFDTNGEQ